MINQLLTMLFMKYVGRFLEGSIRKNSIRAVKTYVEAVGMVRLSFIFAMQVSIATSILVAGFILMVVGIVDLFPIDPRMAAMAAFGVGAVLVIASALGIYVAFSEKRWLRVSKSYELMEAVTAPWPGMIPPNPLDIIRAQPEASSLAMVAMAKTTNSAPAEFSNSKARAYEDAPEKISKEKLRYPANGDFPASALATEGV